VTVNPADLTDLATALSSRADAVTGYGDALSQKVAVAVWSGPVADQFRQSVTQLQHRLATDADRLRATASDLRKLADALDQQLTLLRGIETRVRAWFAANPPGASAAPPPWPQADLPPSGDPRWLDVQRAFAAAGIT
jgi:uncharacterized protein YukE